MRDEDTTAAIYGGVTQQMRGEQISHREQPKRTQVPKGGGNTGIGNKKG